VDGRCARASDIDAEALLCILLSYIRFELNGLLDSDISIGRLASDLIRSAVTVAGRKFDKR